MHHDFIDDYARMQRGYIYEESGGIGIFAFPSFLQAGQVAHGFTARIGGISQAPYDSLNLSFTRPNEPHAVVMENYRRFAARAQIDWGCMVMDHFEHGDHILEVDVSHHGMGYLRDPLPYCDGLITKSVGTALITGHADCVPLYLLDPVRRCIGLAHAGWRGTLSKIGLKAVRMMGQCFGSRPDELLAGVGPCICRHCFEVNKDLAARFLEAFPGVPLVFPGKSDRPDNAYLDLEMANAAQFLEAGIKPENISLMQACTYEDEARLYSHRRDKGKTGGMAAYMQLLPEGSDKKAQYKPAFLYTQTPAIRV